MPLRTGITLPPAMAQMGEADPRASDHAVRASMLEPIMLVLWESYIIAGYSKRPLGGRGLCEPACATGLNAILAHNHTTAPRM